jgi:hypothetical protein
MPTRTNAGCAVMAQSATGGNGWNRAEGTAHSENGACEKTAK